jgi:hypothetical protein
MLCPDLPHNWYAIKLFTPSLTLRINQNNIQSHHFNSQSSDSGFVKVTFGAYPTMPFRSGAYLFKVDSQRAENVQVFDAETLREVSLPSQT